jgi:hypothetical protein
LLVTIPEFCQQLSLSSLAFDVSDKSLLVVAYTLLNVLELNCTSMASFAISYIQQYPKNQMAQMIVSFYFFFMLCISNESFIDLIVELN